MTCALFSYGWLMIPEVMQRLCGRELSSEPAVLPGYARYAIERSAAAVPPVVVPEIGSSVPGRLYRELSESEVGRLDLFEEVPLGLYNRIEALVADSSGNMLTAFVYVPGPKTAVSSVPWKAERIENETGRDAVLRTVQEFLTEYSNAVQNDTMLNNIE